MMRTLVSRFRKIVRHYCWSQRLGIILALLLIVLAFLDIVKQWRGPKVRLHCPQQLVLFPGRIFRACRENGSGEQPIPFLFKCA